jgi:hypothetical protein
MGVRRDEAILVGGSGHTERAGPHQQVLAPWQDRRELPFLAAASDLT